MPPPGSLPRRRGEGGEGAQPRSYMKTPHIKTALPGPKAEAMLKRDAQVVSPS
jgi:hypothetical protein